MWYFTWILGLLLACSLGIINVLRLEAQETWDKEHIDLDPITQLITKETMLGRLQEKVDNSKRNGFPFSILFISLKDFKSGNPLPAYEMEALLRSVVDCFKENIRLGVDIAARMDNQDFLIAMPGSPLKKAEEIAAQVKHEILEHIKAHKDLAVEVTTGVAEFSALPNVSDNTAHEVSKLINIATAKSSLQKLA
ncbi:cytochrome bd-I oxidase subunit CydX [Methylobacter sp. S3L5C]|uniref:cytochrome bd-I oxidase subunit CydX n=1 Tax=Methylobacter sp. S3L5C TaxID=2839024 RepID=UPI002061DB44|nr:cytochrome bd-I oxidase subunit CydX [Methylobacter sp. S3L5C]